LRAPAAGSPPALRAPEARRRLPDCKGSRSSLLPARSRAAFPGPCPASPLRTRETGLSCWRRGAPGRARGSARPAAAPDRIGHADETHGRRWHDLAGLDGALRGGHDNDIRLSLGEIGKHLRKALDAAFRPAHVDRHVAPIFVTEVAKSLAEGVEEVTVGGLGSGLQRS